MRKSFSRAAVVAGVAITTACGGDSPAEPIRRPARDAIVFVHGLGGSAADWNPVIARLKVDGWIDRELAAATYSSIISNETIAQDIRTRVDSILATNGASKVDLVTFSMGGVSSRYYVKNLGGETKVDAWVSVAGPNHGTETACLPHAGMFTETIYQQVRAFIAC